MLNLTKVRISTKGNGSMNMNMEGKGQHYNEYHAMTLTSMTMPLTKFLSIETDYFIICIFFRVAGAGAGGRGGGCTLRNRSSCFELGQKVPFSIF